MATGAAIRPRQGRGPADRVQARQGAWSAGNPRRGDSWDGGAGRAASAGGARGLSGRGETTIADAVAVFAPAKINLFLHVVGRRPDGYHLLDSLVAFADIGDEIVAAPGDELSLAIVGPEAAALAGLGDDNLILRAARALAERFGVKPDIALRLDKQLPAASGIGGGSSDAAATLRALAALWDRPLDPDDVMKLAASLGADVPACLDGRPVWVGGVG
jgi:4-diphosphocytidyl-2-C-methyl-D-erythritol kinase